MSNIELYVVYPTSKSNDTIWITNGWIANWKHGTTKENHKPYCAASAIVLLTALLLVVSYRLIHRKNTK